MLKDGVAYLNFTYDARALNNAFYKYQLNLANLRNPMIVQFEAIFPRFVTNSHFIEQLSNVISINKPFPQLSF
jgi:hypothetical protein